MRCPEIPLTRLRHTELRDFVFTLLSPDAPTATADVYARVLEEFGETTCRPEVICMHTTNSEYKHLVRWVLDDGKQTGLLNNPTRGEWVRIQPQI